MMIVVYGHFTVKPEYRQDMIDLSLALIQPSSSEDGCILYSFLEDASKSGRFVFFEKWKSRADLDAHFETPYFKNFAKHFPDMIIGDGVIEVFEITSSETIT